MDDIAEGEEPEVDGLNAYDEMFERAKTDSGLRQRLLDWADAQRAKPSDEGESTGPVQQAMRDIWKSDKADEAAEDEAEEAIEDEAEGRPEGIGLLAKADRIRKDEDNAACDAFDEDCLMSEEQDRELSKLLKSFRV